jgi:hypothetical protein
VDDLDRYYAFRAALVESLAHDLIGAAETNESFTDYPLERYIAGLLYPQIADSVDAAEDTSNLEDSDDETTYADPPIAMANIRYPSSMGITFAVDPSCTSTVVVTITASTYQKDDPADQARWQRRPLNLDPITLDVGEPNPHKLLDLAEGLRLYVRVRPRDESGAISITLALVNTRTGKPGARDADTFFQPRIHVTSSATEPAFVERKTQRTVDVDDADLRSYRLLYRDAGAYAVGHGCAADWHRTPGTTHANSVQTTFSPTYPLLLADSNPAIASPSLELRYLAEADREEIIDELEALADQYRAWIDQRDDSVRSLESALQEIARDHLEECRVCLGRIRDGIDVLRRHDDAWEAFRFANKAMLTQRARTEWLRGDRTTSEPDLDADHRWRPFQLCFILQCLQGIVTPRHADREIADLLWFPTGGGKTEAYLGLIALVTFLRRLRRDPGDGVTVIMRYTLRLLTIQQFDRAALLIASCEHIRRNNRDRLGESEITIGLWVGQGGSPNSLEQAGRSLERLRNGLELTEANPVQLHECPWCGTGLSPYDYVITNDPRLEIRCRNDACSFHSGLPVFVVDEDLYRYRPTLVIATADKFATMPWNPNTRELFNIGHECPRPELIIQDELHLISGPLGTLAGLYETAVDFLCTDSGIPPKVIASTATIRRAGQQTKGLFTRQMRQFPPPGLDPGDSWFAVESPPDEKGTRLYVGLMAPGSSHSTLLIRAYSALLQAATDIPGDDDVRDPYWTLVGYFNSLRVLGGARMQVQDDVTDRLTLIARNTEPRTLDSDSRIELTSRESSGSVPEHLKRMEKSLGNPDVLDIILATNMISVGVDINRLGLMVVMGQPQSTSEYIQATSRVGRRFPGLVITLFNAARSRDRSHYESFTSYHAALYRQVESTSVTPFSPRARDRGLHAVVIALARLTIPGLSDNTAASDINDYLPEIDSLLQSILDRVQKIDPDAVAETEAELRAVITKWQARAGLVNKLKYSDSHDLDHTLLVDAGDTRDAQYDTFATLRSLRDVDQECGLYLTRGMTHAG